MFLAIMSSGSIASWAIFKEYSFIFGSLIAMSQVLSAVKSYLPFAKRLKSLQGITNDLETLFLEMENEWYNVSVGKLTEEQIHKSYMRYKNKKHQIMQKYLGASPLPTNRTLMEKAEHDVNLYFKTFYSEETANE